jgi:hypothetical protein
MPILSENLLETIAWKNDEAVILVNSLLPKKGRLVMILL